MIEITTEQLAALLDKTAEEVDEAFKEVDKPDQVLNDLFNSRLKAVASEAGNEQYKRATKEVLSKKEKELAEAYGLEPKPISELVSEIEKATTSKVQKELDQSGKIEELESKFSSTIEEKESEIQELQKAIKEKEQSFTRANLQREISQKLPSLLKENSFIIPDGKPGENVMRQLVDELVDSAQLTDQGIVPIDQDGNPLKQDFKAVTFDSFAAQKASNWLTQAQSDGRQGTGTKSQPPGEASTSSFKFDKKDPAKFAKLLRENRGDVEKQKEITEAYKAAPE